jgi:membrane fusion protein (multidrug efflux system)
MPDYLVKVGRAMLAGLVLCSGQAVAQSEYALDRDALRAQLNPVRYTTLAAELGARIKRISVHEGERFKAGQALVEFDCALQQAQLQKARAQLASAMNTHAAHQRMAELNAVGQVELNNSLAEVDKAKADVAYLRATLDKCTVKAPYAGRSGEQMVREQQFVQPGEPLLEILDDSKLQLEFIVPSHWLSWLNPGHRFEVRIEDTGRVYPVKLLRTAARVDPISQSVKAVAVIDGSYPELLAGMSGQVLLKAPADEQGNAGAR